MLGDGHLERDGTNARWRITRKDTDEEYLVLEYNLFRRFFNKGIIHCSYFDKRTAKTYHSVKCSTKCCRAFTEFYAKWYTDKKKVLPDNISFTPLILLIWFLDDGSTSIKKNGRLNTQLSTNGFSKEETERLAKLLSSYFGGYYFGVHKARKDHIIQFSDGASRAFFKVIDPIYPDCMIRKAKWRLPEVRFYDDALKVYGPGQQFRDIAARC
jgi:hypothetical protein